MQDQERNRVYFEECFEVIIKAWTEPSFSHHDEFISIPPRYTRWGHPMTIAYFSQPGVGRALEQVLRLGGLGPGESLALKTTTTLQELQVYPRPLQKPHPQVWMPVTSERSIRWTAAHGINGYTVVEPLSRLKRNIEIYYEEAEKHGWPDRKGRGKFKFGWDAEKHRGYITGRWVVIALPGKEKELWERAALAMKQQWDYYSPFGFGPLLAELGESYPGDFRPTPEFLRENEIIMFGPPDAVIEKIMRLKGYVGYQDLMFNTYFDLGGFTGEELEEQMQIFAEEVMPILRKEYGGGPDLTEVDVRLVPAVAGRV